MLENKTIEGFLDATSAKSPLAPSGGSVMALCAALSAALTELVANVTIDKKGYEEIQAEMREISRELSSYRSEFTDTINNDADAYTKVIHSFKLPKNTLEERQIRMDSIQSSYKAASIVPLKLAQKTFKMLDLIDRVIKTGNKNARGDAFAAKLLAEAVIRASLYNVKVNLLSIKDLEFVDTYMKEAKELEKKLRTKASLTLC